MWTALAAGAAALAVAAAVPAVALAAAPPPPPAAGADPRAAATAAEGAPRPFDRGEFQAFAHARAAGVRDCYEEGLRSSPELAGRVDVRFELLEDGTLADVRVARSALGAPAVEACIVEVMKGWRTPFRPPEPISLEYPFVFRPVSGEGAAPGGPPAGR
jgi:TonB family protein